MFLSSGRDKGSCCSLSYALEGTDFGFRQGQGTFLFSQHSRQPRCEKQPASYSVVTEITGLLAMGKGPGQDYNHSPPSSVEFMNEWIYNHTSPYAFLAWRGTSQRFTFFLTMLQETGGSFVAQAVSRRLLTAEDHVQSPARPCEICGRQIATGTSFNSKYFVFCLYQRSIPTDICTYHRCYIILAIDSIVK